MAKQMTMGVVVGNRGFFPSHLATSGRLEMIAALESAGISPIVLTPEETAHGAVETYEDAKKCAALFKRHAAEIDGIIITLPNFGEERGLGRYAPARQPAGARADPGHAGQRQQDVHRVSSRQLLRQNVHLQQPEAVRHPVFADDAAHGGSGLGGVREGPAVVLAGVPRGQGLP